MASGVFTEWLNANASRNYPILENASRKDTSGNFTLPNDFLLSAQINFSRDYVDGKFYIKSVGSYVDTVSIVLGFLDNLSEVH